MARRKIEELNDDVQEQSNRRSVLDDIEEKVYSQADLDRMLLSAGHMTGIEAVEQAERALTLGADLNAKDGVVEGPNVLFFAATKHQDLLLDYLLEVTKDGKSIDLNYEYGYGQSYLSALLKEDVGASALKKILAKYDLGINSYDKSGQTPLIKAMIANNAKQVEILLDAGADPNIPLRRGGVYPILFAASECFDSIGIPLIEAGADLKVVDSNGHNALLNAMRREPYTLPKSKREGLLKLIHTLLDNPEVEVNLKTESGIQPIFSAITRDENLPFLTKLIARGADVNAKYNDMFTNKGFETPLHVAATAGTIKAVAMLIDAGAKMSVKDSWGMSPESYLLSDLEGQQFLYFRSVDARVNDESPFDEPLDFDVNAIWAEETDDPFKKNGISKETSFKLLVYDFVFSEVEDMEDMQAKQIQQGLINHMIDNGLKLTLKDEPELHSSEPLFITMSLGEKGLSLGEKIIKEGNLDFNFVFNLGNNILKEEHNYFSYLFSKSDSKAAQNIHKAHKKSLNAARKSITKKGRSSGTSSDEEINENKKELKEISDKLNAEKQIQLEELRSAQVKMFKLLIDAGADIYKPIKENGQSAIFSISGKNSFWLRVLHDNGVDIYQKDNDGYTPLDYAILKNDKEVIAEYLSLGAIPENTLYKLAFKDFSDFDNRKSLLATLGIVRALYSEEEYQDFNKNHEKIQLPSTAQSNYLDDDGNSALLVAAANNSSFLAKLLVKVGSDVNTTNTSGQTALQYACYNQDTGLAGVLIEAGANVSAINADGYSARDFAEQNSMHEIVRMIDENKNAKGLKP